MGSLFSKPKSAKAPPPADPVAIPEHSGEVEDWIQRLSQRRSGFARTFLTGNLTPATPGASRYPQKTRLGPPTATPKKPVSASGKKPTPVMAAIIKGMM